MNSLPFWYALLSAVVLATGSGALRRHLARKRASRQGAAPSPASEAAEAEDYLLYDRRSWNRSLPED